MKLISIEDKYIDLLRERFPSVMDNKRFHRTHTRKYLGVLLNVGGKNYYAPLSSPKSRDYDGNGNIKKDNMFASHITKNDEEKKILLGTIKFNNMIPVPMQFVNSFDVNDEGDSKYVSVLKDELKWITKNQTSILKSAKKIYEFKKHESNCKTDKNKRQYDAILPFLEIEAFIEEKGL